MAEKPDQLTQVARERADKRLDQAIGALRLAATEIGKRLGIPEGIQGHSIDELLGRLAYIPSMARELRRAAALELTKLELSSVLPHRALEPSEPIVEQTTRIEPSLIPDQVPAGMDLADLQGITVQTVKALKAAGMTTVGDVVVVPDQHLEKVPGLGAKSVAQLRQAIARASQPKTPA